jgi:hypothetical protein
MKVYKLAVTFGIALVLASCATQPAPLDHTPAYRAGFPNGILGLMGQS